MMMNKNDDEEKMMMNKKMMMKQKLMMKKELMKKKTKMKMKMMMVMMMMMMMMMTLTLLTPSGFNRSFFVAASGPLTDTAKLRPSPMRSCLPASHVVAWQAKLASLRASSSNAGSRAAKKPSLDISAHGTALSRLFGA